MATKKEDAYSRIEQLVMEKIVTLESENARLRAELSYSNAKLEVYERLATITDSKATLGFGPPISKEGGI